VNYEEMVESVGRLEDERGIRALVYRYAALCDDRYKPEAIAALFTEEASWSSTSGDGEIDFGRPKGREAIRQHFARLPERIGSPTFHAVMAPQLSLTADRNTASGTWYTLVLLTMLAEQEKGEEVLLLGATYDHEYRKVNDKWLFSRLDARIHFHLRVGSNT
jgi:hypothetical protein